MSASLTLAATLNLPKHLSFQDLSRELQRTFRTSGGTWRSLEDAAKLYAKEVPASYRTSIQKVSEWMQGRDGSHIIPKSAGGSDQAFNIVLEKHLANIKRGAKPMTRPEQFGIWVEGFVGNLQQAALQGLEAAPIGAAIAVATKLPITFIHYSCAVARGQMTKEEATKAAGKDLLKTGAMGAISTATVVMICSAFTPLATALAFASPVLLAAGTHELIKEYYDVIAENKDILCKWLPKKAAELKEVEEIVRQAREIEAKEKFGVSFWLQWLGVTSFTGCISFLGGGALAGNADSATMGMYGFVSLILSTGFIQWFMVKTRTGQGIQSLPANFLVAAISSLIGIMLMSINPVLGLVMFLGLTGSFTLFSAKRWANLPLPILAV
jgi:hypothetical protein